MPTPERADPAPPPRKSYAEHLRAAGIDPAHARAARSPRLDPEKLAEDLRDPWRDGPPTLSARGRARVERFKSETAVKRCAQISDRKAARDPVARELREWAWWRQLVEVEERFYGAESGSAEEQKALDALGQLALTVAIGRLRVRQYHADPAWAARESQRAQRVTQLVHERRRERRGPSAWDNATARVRFTYRASRPRGRAPRTMIRGRCQRRGGSRRSSRGDPHSGDPDADSPTYLGAALGRGPARCRFPIGRVLSRRDGGPSVGSLSEHRGQQ
jgi:hypothetical protein